MNGIYNIAMSGLQSMKRTVMNHASNIANVTNVGSTKEGEKQPYAPVDTVSISNPDGQGVRTETVLRDPAQILIYDESSPFSNEEGVVAAPNVDLANELVGMKSASTLYKANAAVIRTQQEMDDEIMDILT